MYEFSEAIFRTGRTFSFLLFTFLFVGIVGQLGEPVPKDVENTVTRDSNYNSGNGLKQQDKEESNDKKVWISDANEGEQTSQSPPLKPIVIENTFIACVNDSSILKNATYLNLTQVLENERFKWGDTETSACFMFCKNSAPSDFISVQKAFGYSTQSCGCHSDIEESLDAKQHFRHENLDFLIQCQTNDKFFERTFGRPETEEYRCAQLLRKLQENIKRFDLSVTTVRAGQ